jgi:hypothetical protein
MSTETTTATLVRLAREHGAELAGRPGLSGTVALTVAASGPGGHQVTLRWGDGRLVDASEGPPSDADLELTLGRDDAAALLAGELDASVAFMRGRLKTAGDNGLVLDVLEVTTGPGFAAWLDAARAAAVGGHHPESPVAP